MGRLAEGKLEEILHKRIKEAKGRLQDSQLWSDDADCMVHFHAYGSSLRGASLRVPFPAIEKLNSRYLLDECVYTRDGSSPFPSDDSGYGSSLSTISEHGKIAYYLHIPAPVIAPPDETFSYHITTRNVIAYALGKPVVGEKLSIALIDLWARLREWLPNPSPRAEFTTYLERQGYSNFAENPEHALACLKFAEETKFNAIWVDAFVHCVGMHERLVLSPEFAGISNTTTALVTRASLEMDLHIGRVTRALGGFLEEELGPEHLGLSKPARDHLDHFRSFLHAFYVDKLGWFPPRETAPWDKRPWREMQNDFQRLYDYLADVESSGDWTSSRGVTGGICIIQNVQAFDLRHGYEPLEHPLPLLPKPPPRIRRSISSQRGLRNLKLGRTNSIPEPKLTPSQALVVATNNLNAEAVQSSLVQEYQRFERQKLDAKLDIVEARKIRWILIYSVMQMLTSIMRSPKEVKDTKTPSYPLCVLTTGCPRFDEEDEVEESVDVATKTLTTTSLVPDALDALEGRSSRISIHPDCEADSAEDFFAANVIARQDSQMSLNNMVPSPLRSNTQLSRTASIRSSVQFGVQALHKSVVGSLSRRNSNRRASLPLEPRKSPSYCEIVVENYDRAVDGDQESPRPQTAFHAEEQPHPDAVDPFLEFDFGLASTNGVPILDPDQLNIQTEELDTVAGMDRSPCESHFSMASADLLDSNRSSYANGNESTDTDLSSWDGDSYKRDSVGSNPETPLGHSDHDQTPSPPKQLCYQPSYTKLGKKMANGGVNAGCYIPSGMFALPRSKFAHNRAFSGDTVHSDVSSDYPEESNQAADIEESETRGRRRTRGLRRMSLNTVVG